MLPPAKAIPDIEEKDLFAASYVKLARARHFIQELEAEAERYKNSDPTSVRLDHEANPPNIHVEWKGVTLMPGAIIGDAVHNLRTALDLMASELARIKGSQIKTCTFHLPHRLIDLTKRSNREALIKPATMRSHSYESLSLT